MQMQSLLYIQSEEREWEKHFKQCSQSEQREREGEKWLIAPKNEASRARKEPIKAVASLTLSFSLFSPQFA